MLLFLICNISELLRIWSIHKARTLKSYFLACDNLNLVSVNYLFTCSSMVDIARIEFFFTRNPWQVGPFCHSKIQMIPKRYLWYYSKTSNIFYYEWQNKLSTGSAKNNDALVKAVLSLFYVHYFRMMLAKSLPYIVWIYLNATDI